MVREIILDTETTGLNPKDGHRLIEIGALEMVNKVLTGEKFHFYINPERDVPEEAYRIHGISTESLKDKPLFKEIVHDFLDFIRDGDLIIHNAPFDIKFLNHELSLLNLPSLGIANVVDTLVMAKKSFPGARVSLDALCKRFKVDNSDRYYHGALKDARLLSEVYVELTGGRQTSFSLSNSGVKACSNARIINEIAGNKIIIRPTTEEMLLHKQFMAKIS